MQQASANGYEDAVRTEREVMRIATDLGARNLSDLDMGAYYAEACAWAVQGLEGLGRYGDARRTGEDCMVLADQLLERRPGYRLALHAQGILAGVLASVRRTSWILRPRCAWVCARSRCSSRSSNSIPTTSRPSTNFAVAEGQLGDSLWAAGHLREAVPFYLKQLDYVWSCERRGRQLRHHRSFFMAGTAFRQAQLGEAAAAAATLAAGAPSSRSCARASHGERASGPRRCHRKVWGAWVASSATMSRRPAHRRGRRE